MCKIWKSNNRPTRKLDQKINIGPNAKKCIISTYSGFENKYRYRPERGAIRLGVGRSPHRASAAAMPAGAAAVQ